MGQIVSSSDLKRQFGAWLDWVGRTREELVVETYGRPVAVLLAYEEYADYLAYRQLHGREPAAERRRSGLTPLPRTAGDRRPPPPADDDLGTLQA